MNEYDNGRGRVPAAIGKEQRIVRAMDDQRRRLDGGKLRPAVSGHGDYRDAGRSRLDCSRA